MDIKLVSRVHHLRNSVKHYTRNYFHTNVLATSASRLVLDNTLHCFKIHYGLKDLLFIGAITENPILLTGGTDLGKTTLAKYMMNALFGQEESGWHRLDFDLDFGKDAYTNINSEFFHESGKTLEDLYSLHNWMRLPGFIADELNGAHPKIARKALHIIKEKDITLADGRREKIGIKINDTTYQFQVATINEGSGYSGTFEMDKALRRRTTIEIPMDSFYMTPFDSLMLKKESQEETFENKQNNFELVYEIKTQLDTLKLHPIAEFFISYLEAFNFCKNSLTKEKGSICTRNGSIRHICTQPVKIGQQETPDGVGCEFLREFEYDLCPNVNGITPGISKNLISVAKGFSILRAIKFAELLQGFLKKQYEKHLSYSLEIPEKFEESLRKYVDSSNLDLKSLCKKVLEKYVERLEVEKEDIKSAIGFVGYSKIGITDIWTTKHFQGNKFHAIRHFVNEVDAKFKDGLNNHVVDVDSLSRMNEEGLAKIEEYCTKSNPWLWRVISPYFQESQVDDEVQLYD